jgi:2-oxoglutarate ferredoxin oxidoreductase subunit alpha
VRNVLSDFTMMVAGQGGDGSLTVVNLLAELLGGRGFHLYGARNVASRIKGGHAAAFLRASTTSRGCLGDHIDLLVAFDAEAIEVAAASMAHDGVIVYDASAGPIPAGHLPGGARVFEVPFGRLAVRDLRRDLFKNSLAFAVVGRILGVADDDLVSGLRHRLRRLPDHLIEANVKALGRGFEYATGEGLAAGASFWRLASVDYTERLYMSGNEAIAFGFMVAGGRFFCGYPITPATDIMDWLGSRLPSVGGVVLQVEDELAAINMAAGAAMTGTRAMVASSGPGIALMQEGISHLGSAEIPLVVVDCQRAGPSTGMPTKPEQSDIGMLVFGGNGDYPRVVLAPGDPQDGFELAVLATNLAQRAQLPVFLALDQAVAQNPMTIPPFDLSAVEIEPGPLMTGESLAGLAEYRRYQVTEDGISPWALPGTPGGMSLITGNEHTEWGHVSTDPSTRRAMMEKRGRKIDTIRHLLPAGRHWGEPAARVGLLGIGMELGAMVEAAERLPAAGLRVACLQPRTLWPVHSETLEFLERHDRVYVIEHNAGAQLRSVLTAAGAAADKLESILRYDGTPFQAAELVDDILRREGGRS